MYLFENKITLESKEEIESFVNEFPHETSGLTFSSLYMWRNQNYFSYEIINDFLCVSGLSNFEGFQDEPFVFPLLPRNGDCDRNKMRITLLEIIDRFEKAGSPFVMRLIPPHMQSSYMEVLPGKFLFLNDRPNHDYVYLVDDLAELRGRKLHSKKNHVNRFNKEFEGRYEVVPMSSALKDDALGLLKYVDEKKQVDGFEADMLKMEADVLEDIIPNFDRLGLEGCGLLIDGKLQAYAFGGRLGDDTIVEHVEKANIDYPGIYQKINQEFCKMCRGRYTYVNREEDMGLLGLRQAKLSYKPVKLIEKSIAMVAGDEEAIRRYSFVE
ncbi:MAG: DUF2156 domain-containing protein [Firmicutes bacterium]|nr:DUF2156 domain-containing protein [Bacillota bacterium]